MKLRPILFNTESVRAILDGRKTVTRMVVKPPALYAIVEDSNGKCVGSWYEDERCGYSYPTIDDCRYQPGDILYVRETWAFDTGDPFDDCGTGYFVYKADYSENDLKMDEASSEIISDFLACLKWHPSIHMPREAARIFLRVTDVRVERLQDITPHDALWEGIDRKEIDSNGIFREYSPKAIFSRLWDSTIKPADRALYGWDASPWVWVIEFERISKEEAYSEKNETLTGDIQSE